jgi:hypothetical protein
MAMVEGEHKTFILAHIPPINGQHYHKKISNMCDVVGLLQLALLQTGKTNNKEGGDRSSQALLT